ncbi:hypothetical protein RRG08_023166 [Elysia crispata]|uniref:Uncharacterized protein n=1 Tax=Elysia crispata TaxID=231223 RepID=A0AAE1CJ29_9GAST|nr:hypothetical protein RRG08_023166 [Elysia crispata]
MIIKPAYQIKSYNVDKNILRSQGCDSEVNALAVKRRRGVRLTLLVYNGRVEDTLSSFHTSLDHHNSS